MSGKQTKHHATSPTNLPIRIAQRWALSGLIGLTTSTVLMAKGTLDFFPIGIEFLATLAAGWGAMLCTGPWKQTHQLQQDRNEIRRLTKKIGRLHRNGHREQLNDLLSPREDDIGKLCKALHGTITTARVDRRKKKMIERDLHRTVQQETNRATAKLQREALTDPLTGLGNRRALDKWLIRLLHPEQRVNGPVVALVLDLDHFKQVNDTLGHDIGDQVLVFVGQLLRSCLRLEDYAIRSGGDEFIVLMPGQSLDDAQRVAKRISALFTQMPWSYPSTTRPGLSIGLAAMNPSIDANPAELIRCADAAAYASKRAGRGTITLFNDIADAA